MSFPAARWRCQLIGRGRGPRAGLGASLAAAGAQLSGKNRGGCCGEISYRSLGGAAGPRSALTAAHPGRARRAGGGPAPPPLPPPPVALPLPPSLRPALLSHSSRRGIDPRRLARGQAPPPLGHPARGPRFGGARELAARKAGRWGRGRVAPAERGRQVHRVGAGAAPGRWALGPCCLGRCVTALSLSFLVWRPG